MSDGAGASDTGRAGSSRRVPERLVVASEISARGLLVLVAILALGVVLRYLAVVAVPLVLGLFASTLLRPPAAWLQRHRVPATLAAWIVTLLSLALLFGALAVAGVAVARDLPELTEAVSEGWDRVLRFLDRTFGVAPEEVRGYIQGSAPTGSILSGARTLLEIGAGAIITLFLTFFFVKDGPRLFDAVLRLLPGRRRGQARTVGDEVWSVLGAFLRGMALTATFNAVLKGVALVAIGIPLVIPLVIITFFGSFVPFLGPVLAAAAAALVALAHGSVVDAGLVIGAGFAIQQIEGNVLEPLILGRFMRLHPVLVLLTVTVGALVAGIAGAFLAVPTLAATIATIQALRRTDPDDSNRAAAGEAGEEEADAVATGAAGGEEPEDPEVGPEEERERERRERAATGGFRRAPDAI